jgi:hypothetical protein
MQTREGLSRLVTRRLVGSEEERAGAGQVS